MRLAVLAVILLAAGAAHADEPGPTFGSNFRFTEQGGAAVYGAVCAGCHMPNGQGAAGAGTYPSLANNARLAAAGYPIARVIHGNKAMPAFGRMLNDAQIAAVVGFIRTHFGNDYPDPPSAADIAASR